MEAMLTYNFMQRAMLAGLFIALSCSILGIFLILRRDAMIGHGLAHVTFGGVALGLFLKITPLLVAVAVAALCAIGVVELKKKASLYGDTAIGIFSSIGMATGVVLASLASSFNVDLLGYLFGNILAIEKAEVLIAIILTIVVLLVIVLFYQELLYITFDPESAKTSGIHVARLDSVLAILVAVTVVLGMKVVGLLLVAALLVIPSAAGLQLAGSFRQAVLFSCLIAAGSLVSGLFMAFYWDLPASGTIILSSFVIFVILFCVRLMKRRR
ncbi:MAG: metal ABC transporter permease [Nitrospirota bacterium]